MSGLKDADLLAQQEARRLCTRGKAAQRTFKTFPQEDIDHCVEAIHQACLPHLEEWARMAVEETGFGNVPDKTTKNRFTAVDLYESLRGEKTVGLLREDSHRQVMEFGEPAGLVLGILPSTNPTSTAVYKIMIAVKAGCGIVVSPHPAALRCTLTVVDTLAAALHRAGAPEGLVSGLRASTMAAVREMMGHASVDLILATGGMGVVRAAYSSGKPAYGVGPGNVPVFIERSADVEKAVADLLFGKTFDYGTLCSSEQAVIADEPVAEPVAEALARQGGYFVPEADVPRLQRAMFQEDGGLSRAIIGKSATVIAERAGLRVPEGTRALIVRCDGVGPEAPFSREKLSPVLAFYVARDWRAGCRRCLEILANGGTGHTLGLHTRDRQVVKAFGLEKPACRIVVNSNTCLGAVGVTTALAPSMTLGCGTLGGNITSDNITARHLVNVKRVAFETRPLATARAAASAAPPRPTADPPPTNLEDRIDQFLDGRGYGTSAADAPPAATASAPPPAPVPVSLRRKRSPAVQEFVCEADVRRAAREGRRLAVDGRTIITPAAQELGAQTNVFLYR